MIHVTKETAVLLKEKGFDLPSRQYFDDRKEVQNTQQNNPINWNQHEGLYSAPTHQEATEWLRAKEVHVYVVPVNLWQQWRMFIYLNSYPPQKSRIPDKPMDFTTHDEALEAGIIHALKYLP
jgi:hypothetical protein